MENKLSFTPNPDLKLMDQVQEVLRYFHYSYATEKSYCSWIVRYLRHYNYKSHPRDMGAKEIQSYLSYLASERQVSASTQKQAMNAIVFLYKKVLGIELSDITPTKSKKPLRLPVVMTKEEVAVLFSYLQGIHLLMAQLMYGCGLRIMECHRLRLKDIEFGQGYIFVREGKGGDDRTIPIPHVLVTSIEQQVGRVLRLHSEDLANGYGTVYIPQALARKYPNASRESGWQYLFPSKKISADPRTGEERRHHVLESGLQKAIKRSAIRAKITKKVSSHTLRHSYATHLLEDGVNIRIVQKLMGHKDVKTTEIYTHVMKKDIDAVISPLDTLVACNKNMQTTRDL